MDAKHLAARYLASSPFLKPDPQEIAEILKNALASAAVEGLYDEPQVLVIQGAHKSFKDPKHGFGDPESPDYEAYQVQAQQAMTHWRNLLGPLLQCYGDRIEVATEGQEKGWIYTTITFPNALN